MQSHLAKVANVEQQSSDIPWKKQRFGQSNAFQILVEVILIQRIFS